MTENYLKTRILKMNKEDLILELLKEIKEDYKGLRAEMKEGFEKSEENMKEFQREVRADLREERSRINDIYDARHEVEYKMTRDVILRNIGWNLSIIIIGVFLAEAVLH